MNKKDLYKGNEIVVYEKWQTVEKEIGVVKLISKIRNGESFILDDLKKINVPEKIEIYNNVSFSWKKETKPLSRYPIYNYERWLCKLIKSNDPSYKEGLRYSLNIRYLLGIYKDSLSKTSIKRDLKESEYIENCLKENKPLDNFMIVNGVEIF